MILCDHMVQEVKDLFTRFNGFMEKKEPSFAFFDFSSHGDATEAMHRLDGHMLSDGTRLRISFAQITPEAAPHRTLYLRYLSTSLTTKELRAEFSAFGDVESIDHLPYRGMAFIKFDHLNDAINAKKDLGEKYSIQYYVKHYKDQVMDTKRRMVEEERNVRFRRDRFEDGRKESDRERERVKEKDKENEFLRGAGIKIRLEKSPKTEETNEGTNKEEQKRRYSTSSSESSSSSSSSEDEKEKKRVLNGKRYRNQEEVIELKKDVRSLTSNVQRLSEKVETLLNHADHYQINVATLQKQIRQHEKEIQELRDTVVKIR